MGYRVMSSDRPVILTVERRGDIVGAEQCEADNRADLIVSGMRQMGAVEYAWYRFKKLLTSKNKKQAAVNDDTLKRTGMYGMPRVGIEVSTDLWNRLVFGHASTSTAWVWLNKDSNVILSPIPPSDIALLASCRCSNECKCGCEHEEDITV